MAYDFYKSEEYRKKQSERVKAAWKRGDFDFTKKVDQRVCIRKGCHNIFMASPSNPKRYCCRSCAAIVNNTGVRRWGRTPGNCINCGGKTARTGYKYCGNACQMDYQFNSYINRWKAGEIKGLTTIGTVTPHIKKYLRGKFNNRCSLCGWSKTNPATGRVPLVADHIDGNWQNNSEDNLRLLCPNCDSLTATFCGLNKGNGRKDRVLSRRSLAARSLRI